MRADPRCPSCNGKVSATADWCMHCGADFDRPAPASADSAGGRSWGAGTAGSEGSGESGGTSTHSGSVDDVDELIAAFQNRSSGASPTDLESDDDTRAGAAANSPTAAATGAGLAETLERIEADDKSKKWLAIGIAVVGWYLLGSVGTPAQAASGFAFLGAVALYFHVRDMDAKTMLVRSAYALAGLIVVLRALSVVIATELRAGPEILLIVLDFGTIVVLALLVGGGHWIDENVPDVT